MFLISVLYKNGSSEVIEVLQSDHSKQLKDFVNENGVKKISITTRQF